MHRCVRLNACIGIDDSGRIVITRKPLRMLGASALVSISSPALVFNAWPGSMSGRTGHTLIGAGPSKARGMLAQRIATIVGATRSR